MKSDRQCRSRGVDCAVMAVPTTNSCDGLWVIHCRAGKADRKTNCEVMFGWAEGREVITRFWAKTCPEILCVAETQSELFVVEQFIISRFVSTSVSHSNDKNVFFVFAPLFLTVQVFNKRWFVFCLNVSCVPSKTISVTFLSRYALAYFLQRKFVLSSISSICPLNASKSHLISLKFHFLFKWDFFLKFSFFKLLKIFMRE